MFSLLLFLTVAVGYYYYCQYYPREWLDHIYFGVFMSVWLTIIYLMNFQEMFVYRVFKQLYEVQQKPLYDVSVFTTTKDENTEFKEFLLSSQGSRCASCQNFILPSDIKYTHLSYKVPLEQGGAYDPHNLQIVCPNCNQTFY
tara:strand:+ start:103 stop:528 length:426 start_codon:yes stop_codon:yes gene_type:complete